MARNRKVTELDQPQGFAPQPPTEESQETRSFQVTYDDEKGTVSFELSDGTPVVMQEPKTRQLLLLENWRSQVEPEYRSNSFMAFKLASLCVTKFGKANKASFDQIVDLGFEDAERMAKALECFRDFFEHLQQRAAAAASARAAGNDTQAPLAVVNGG